MVTSNDLPAIDDPTDAMWRRVLLVPWTVQVPATSNCPSTRCGSVWPPRPLAS